MKFIVEVKAGQATVTTVQGRRELTERQTRELDIRDIIQAEQTLERLTGLRWHILQRGE